MRVGEYGVSYHLHLQYYFPHQNVPHLGFMFTVYVIHLSVPRMPHMLTSPHWQHLPLHLISYPEFLFLSTLLFLFTFFQWVGSSRDRVGNFIQNIKMRHRNIVLGKVGHTYTVLLYGITPPFPQQNHTSLLKPILVLSHIFSITLQPIPLIQSISFSFFHTSQIHQTILCTSTTTILCVNIIHTLLLHAYTYACLSLKEPQLTKKILFLTNHPITLPSQPLLSSIPFY